MRFVCTDIYVNVCNEVNYDEFVMKEWKKDLSLFAVFCN